MVMPLIQMVELARGRAGQKPSGLQANVLTGPAEQKADIHGQPPGGEQGPASTQDAFIEGPNRSGRARPADCSAPAPARLAAAQHHVHNSREVRQTGFSVQNYSEKWPTATDGDTGGEA